MLCKVYACTSSSMHEEWVLRGLKENGCCIFTSRDWLKVQQLDTTGHKKRSCRVHEQLTKVADKYTIKIVNLSRGTVNIYLKV